MDLQKNHEHTIECSHKPTPSSPMINILHLHGTFVNFVELILIHYLIWKYIPESACNAGYLGSIPRLGRSPGEGKGNPLQYSCLENPIDRGTWWATIHGVARRGHNVVTKAPYFIWLFLLFTLCAFSAPGACSWTQYTVLPCVFTLLLPMSVSDFPCFWWSWEASLVSQTVKRLPAIWETWVWSLGWEDPLEKEMATHSSTLAWKITWMEEPGGLYSPWVSKSQTWLSDFSLSLTVLSSGQGFHKMFLCWEVSEIFS